MWSFKVPDSHVSVSLEHTFPKIVKFGDSQIYIHNMFANDLYLSCTFESTSTESKGAEL